MASGLALRRGVERVLKWARPSTAPSRGCCHVDILMIELPAASQRAFAPAASAIASVASSSGVDAHGLQRAVVSLRLRIRRIRGALGRAPQRRGAARESRDRAH